MQVERVFLFNKEAYKKDIKYKKLLAKNSGTNPEDLSSIIGEQELTDLLNKAKRTSFYPGDTKRGAADDATMEKLKDNNYAFNLHIHTTASDGDMTPQKLLDISSKYADLLNKYTGNFFTIAITDHDTMEADKDVIQEVAKNPEKYKNLKIVLGTELSSQYVDKKKLNKPVTYEMVAYCVNPYDKKSQEFLEKLRLTRIEMAKKLVQDAYKKYPQHRFSYEEACSYSNNPKKGINGFLYSLADYFNLKAPEIDVFDLSLKYLPDNEKQDPVICYEGNEIAKAFNKNCGFYALAHPGRYDFNRDRKNGAPCADVIIDDFINYLKKTFGKGFKAIETNYYGYRGSLAHASRILINKEEYNEKYRDSIRYLLKFRRIAQDNSLLETGGMDTHYESPFAK